MNLNNIKLIDLTHPLSAETPHWSGNCGFQKKICSDYADWASETKFRVHQIEMYAGIGTHMDAPLHCFEHGKSIADIELEKLFVPCVVIDIPANASENYRLQPEDIINFEKTKTKIEKNTFVIVRTGWGKHWHNPSKYRNELIFPSVAATAAELLLEKDIVGIGIDTLSPDIPQHDYPVHNIMLGAGKYIIENIANAHLLPAYGSTICALPIKIKDGTEAPIRLVGII
jgi:kynurenine formamidase